jgi:hypothetical protein
MPFKGDDVCEYPSFLQKFSQSEFKSNEDDII